MSATHSADRSRGFILPLLGIILLGAALRFHHLAGSGIWLDEAASWRVASGGLGTIVTKLGLNPPLFDLLLHFWIRLFGESETALRSLPALLGTLAIGLVGLVGRRLYDRFTGILSALLLAIMVFPIHYARDARPYSLLLLATLGSFYYYIRVLEERRRGDWAGYCLATLALCLTHSYWVFALLAQNTHRLLFAPRTKAALARWAVAQAAMLAAVALWAGRGATRGAHVIQTGFWIPRPGLSDLLAALRSDVGFLVPPLLLLLPAGLALIALLDAGRPDGAALDAQSRDESVRDAGRPDGAALSPRSRAALLGLWFLTPILGPFLLSQFMTPMFWPRYAIGAVPALYVLMARGLLRLPGRWLQGAAIPAMLALSAAGLINYNRSPAVSGRWQGSYVSWEVESWRETVALLSREVRPTDLVLVAPEYARAPFEYYARDRIPALSVPGVADPRRPWGGIIRGEISLQPRTRAWLVFRRHPSQKGERVDEYLQASYEEIPVAWPAGANPVIALFDLTRGPAAVSGDAAADARRRAGGWPSRGVR